MPVLSFKKKIFLIASIPIFLLSLTFFVFQFGKADNSTNDNTVISSETPTIDLIYPTDNKIRKGQVITISGKKFGYVTGKIEFINQNSNEATLADLNLPQNCLQNTLWWQNEYLIARVPSTLSESAKYKIQVTANNNQKITYNSEFQVLSGTGDNNPFVCALSPDNGKTGLKATIYGGNFGTRKGQIKFGTGTNAINIDVGENDWQNELISFVIPGGASSGQVQVVVPSGSGIVSGDLTNPAFYRVSTCEGSAGVCHQNQECCNSSCVAINSCQKVAPKCTYGWSFKTGSGGIGDVCQSNESCLSGRCQLMQDQRLCVRGENKEGASCDNDLQCFDGLWCREGKCSSTLKNNSEVCEVNDDCRSGFCQNKKCSQNDEKIGSSCKFNEECVSNNCQLSQDGKSGTCVDKVEPVTVVEVHPLAKNGSDKVCFNKEISIKFNQIVNEENLIGKVKIEKIDSTGNKIINHDSFYTLVEYDSQDKPQTVLSIDAKIEKNSFYKITVLGGESGVKSLTSSQMASDYSFDIKTKDQECSLAKVIIKTSPDYQEGQDLFTCSQDNCSGDQNSLLKGNQHNYVVEGFDENNEGLNDLESIDWTQSKPEMVDLNKTDSQDILATAKSINGKSDLKVSVKRKGGKEQKDGLLQVSNFFCDFPWVYQDQKLDFAFKYCRGNKSDELLPSLEDKPVVKDYSGAKYEKEYIFKFKTDLNQPVIKDAIALRTVRNDKGISLMNWYFQKDVSGKPVNVPSFGNPTPTIVDGYQALRDGQTVYISAVNWATNKGLYIYIFSYSADQKTSTTMGQIFDTLLGSLELTESYAAHIDNSQKLRRDVLRTADLRDMQYMINSRFVNGSYPTLDSGTYIPGQTISAWPSWQGTLGNSLGTALPLDPLIANNSLGCTESNFNMNTCWDGAAQAFKFGGNVKTALEKGKYAYTYSYNATKKDYEVCARFEIMPDLKNQLSSQSYSFAAIQPITSNPQNIINTVSANNYINCLNSKN